MEVHHHGHHGDSKGWKSYLKEFFMLFLAVLCGFLAEWRFEHMIENHREKEYIESIVVDILADSKQADSLANILDKTIQKVDTLLNVLASDSAAKQGNNLHRLWGRTMGFPDFIQNDRTIQQLKSSGSLRLIRKKGVSDNIMEYDQKVRLIDITQNNLNNVASNSQFYSQFFDFIAIHKKQANIPLKNASPDKLSEAYANRMYWKLQLMSLHRKLVAISKKGIETAVFIKREYELE